MTPVEGLVHPKKVATHKLRTIVLGGHSCPLLPWFGHSNLITWVGEEARKQGLACGVHCRKRKGYSQLQFKGKAGLEMRTLLISSLGLGDEEGLLRAEQGSMLRTLETRYFTGFPACVYKPLCTPCFEVTQRFSVYLVSVAWWLLAWLLGTVPSFST